MALASDSLRRASSLADLVSAVSGRRPAADAVTQGTCWLTYAELDAASDRLAARLMAKGVGRGQYVGLLAERDVATPLGILGILKTGAAYVPLDPSYPSARLRFIADDVGMTVLVGDADRAKGLGLGDLEVVAPWQGREGGLADRPEVAADDPAYVIYTSGSTGPPKGCVVSHGSVLELLGHALPLFDVGPTDRWALFHSASFDVSVWELWSAFATGATAVVVPSVTAQSPEELVEFLVRERITILNQVPTVFRYLAFAHTDAGRPALRLRYLVFAGESVDLEVIRQFVSALESPPTVVNMYGITEATVHSTFKVLGTAVLAGQVCQPIGRPLPHTVIELRDVAGDLVPAGEVGEIFVSGTGLALGYLNRPGLTAERFVRCETPTGALRCYRSGDLARLLPDGELEYLGRTDRQVKLRGFRIELGEVEAVFRSNDRVRDVAVDVVTGKAGDRFLMAWVVPVADAPPSLVPELRSYAGRLVPSHLVPARFRIVPKLPTTASGKLDRAALPSW
ncbi:amino acid adenylation domain-containing protein [Micromonospora sp. NPDC051227]|uniref:amino acid adenylation domain-containing protein n=1 Tax=Micromonospora sp. NPDC051227 TaxID=3364285 RepID=UPI0037920FCE